MTLAELRKQCELVGPLGDAYEFEEGGTYIVFVDPLMIDIDALAKVKQPSGVKIQMIPVIPAPGRTIDDAIRIYQEKTH